MKNQVQGRDSNLFQNDRIKLYVHAKGQQAGFSP